MPVVLSLLSGLGAFLVFLAFADVLPVIPCRRTATPGRIEPRDVFDLEGEIAAFVEAATSGDERGAERLARAAFRIAGHGLGLRRWSQPLPPERAAPAW